MLDGGKVANSSNTLSISGSRFYLVNFFIVDGVVLRDVSRHFSPRRYAMARASPESLKDNLFKEKKARKITIQTKKKHLLLRQ